MDEQRILLEKAIVQLDSTLVCRYDMAHEHYHYLYELRKRLHLP